MRRAILAIVVLIVALIGAALPAAALDLGHAEGSLTIDKTRYDLAYAYALNRQKNELNNRNELTKIVLTDKPLAEPVNLAKIEDAFPDGITAVVVYVDGSEHVSRVLVQHPAGMFDAGFFEGIPDYRYKSKKGERGTVSGNVSAKGVKTNTMTFSYDVEFAAAVK